GGADIVRDQNRPLVEAKRIQQTKHPTRLIAHLDIQAFLGLGLTEAHQVWRNRSQSSRSEQGHYIPPKQLRGGKSVQKQNGSPAPFIPDIYVHVAERNTSHPASIRQAKDSAQTSRSVPLPDVSGFQARVLLRRERPVLRPRDPALARLVFFRFSSSFQITASMLCPSGSRTNAAYPYSSRGPGAPLSFAPAAIAA